MNSKTLFVAFSTQKGGVGKTTFTVLAASYLHYLKGYNVVVVDCDYPQHSITAMRKRDSELVYSNHLYILLAYYQFKALNKISFNVKEGEILGLLGPNGSGKSTTIYCLLSLLNYQGGSIKIFGENMTADSYDIKAKIGIVFQDVAVFDELTVYENIDYFCGLYIKDKDIRKTYVEEAIELVSLNDFRNFRPKKLSGGLLRRLNIACGVAHKPSLLFLDEPTVAVDPQSRNNILEGIKKLNQSGTTVIYTTHYMEEVEMICNRIIIIDKGEIIASGTKEEQ